jgi:hypothetical protein
MKNKMPRKMKKDQKKIDIGKVLINVSINGIPISNKVIIIKIFNKPAKTGYLYQIALTDFTKNGKPYFIYAKKKIVHPVYDETNSFIDMRKSKIRINE